jgi:hypothetical protein
MHPRLLGAIALMLASITVASARAGSAPVPGIYPWSDQVRSDPFRRNDDNDRLFPWARSDQRVCGYEQMRVRVGTTPRWRRVYRCR